MNRNNEESEQELRESFQRLRADDATATPEFHALLHRTRPSISRTGTPHHQRNLRNLRNLRIAVAALALLAVLIWRTRRHPAEPGYAIDLASTTWHGPTDFLLAYPTDPALRTVPRLGDLNWRTP
jgi:hypothetical protein